MRQWKLLAAMAVALLAGCSASPPAEQRANLPNPENVKILQTGHLSQGGKHVVTWNVTAPTADFHARRFHFEFRATRMASPTPPLLLRDLHYRLLDGGGAIVTSQANETVAADDGSCLLCADPKGDAGTWRFEFGSSPSAADYSVAVDVEYDGGPAPMA